MLPIKIAASAATLSLVLSPIVARAELPESSCWHPAEAPAASMFAFATMLAVGTLKCRMSDTEIIGAYNGFMDARGPMIARNADRVRAHFMADRGPTAGDAAFSDYETALANLYSSDALYDRGCATVSAYARLATRANEADLIALAQATDRTPPEMCRAIAVRAPAFIATRPTEPVEVAAAIGDGSTTGPAVPAEPVAIVSPMAAAQPIAAKATATPTAASALADAARALASAAAALEAQSQATPPGQP